MQKKILVFSALITCQTVFALNCPDPNQFIIKPCTPGVCDAKYYLEVPAGYSPKNHPGDREILITNHFEFKKVSWGGAHNYYPKIVCEYQDPEHDNISYHLTLLSHELFKRSDFHNHSNWQQIGNEHYQCLRNSVYDCAFR